MNRQRWAISLVALVSVSLLAACARPPEPPRPLPPWSYTRTSPGLSPFWWYDTVDVGRARTLKQSTGAGVTVAIVDTGILPGHPDLPPARGVATCGTNPADITDRKGHGTQLAGIVAGQDVGLVTQGVAGRASLAAIRIDCGLVTANSLTRGIDAALAALPGKSGILLLAVGGYPAGLPDAHALLEQRAREHPGVLFVVASVWDGTTYPFPAWAGLGNTIAVAAMTLDDTRTREVPFNAKRGEIWAPGRDVGTASMEMKDGAPARYLMQGTSAAAAIVAGCAALVMEKQPGLAADAVKRALISAAQPQPDLGPAPDNRRLDCYQAVP